ncbi:hypothetical protein [Methanospirillum sp.]
MKKTPKVFGNELEHRFIEKVRMRNATRNAIKIWSFADPDQNRYEEHEMTDIAPRIDIVRDSSNDLKVVYIIGAMRAKSISQVNTIAADSTGLSSQVVSNGW